VLAIVLALAVGPNAAAICGLWCPEEVTAAEYCDHGSSDSPLIAAENCCDDLAPDTVAVVQTAVRSDASSTHGVPAVSLLRNPFVDSGRPARPNRVPGSRRSIDGRPQTTVLRI
jgi:hypothetical protein